MVALRNSNKNERISGFLFEQDKWFGKRLEDDFSIFDDMQGRACQAGQPRRGRRLGGLGGNWRGGASLWAAGRRV